MLAAAHRRRYSAAIKNSRMIKMRLFQVLNTIAALTCCLGTGVASATQLSTPTVGTCTGQNCASVLLKGNTFVTEGRTLPFVAQLFAGKNQCLRIETTQQTADLRIVVVAPNGVVYNNDDGGSCSLCSLVKILTGSQSGYYTVQLAQYGGVPVESNFTIQYGRYNAANPNCSGPTAPQMNRKTPG